MSDVSAKIWSERHTSEVALTLFLVAVAVVLLPNDIPGLLLRVSLLW